VTPSRGEPKVMKTAGQVKMGEENGDKGPFSVANYKKKTNIGCFSKGQGRGGDLVLNERSNSSRINEVICGKGGFSAHTCLRGEFMREKQSLPARKRGKGKGGRKKRSGVKEVAHASEWIRIEKGRGPFR